MSKTIPKTYPFILCHGIARLDIIFQLLLDVDNRDKFDSLNVFKGLRTFLRSQGFSVENSWVGFAQSLDKRAHQLKLFVEKVLKKYHTDKVHLLCHSMGGLDARRMLWNFRGENFHRHIASITTFSTPHHGSPVAKWVLEKTPIGVGYRYELSKVLKTFRSDSKSKNASKTKYRQLSDNKFDSLKIPSVTEFESSKAINSDEIRSDLSMQESNTTASSLVSQSMLESTTKTITKASSFSSSSSSSSSSISHEPPPSSLSSSSLKPLTKDESLKNAYNIIPQQFIHNIHFLMIECDGVIDLFPEMCEINNMRTFQFEAHCGVAFRAISSKTDRSLLGFVKRRNYDRIKAFEEEEARRRLQEEKDDFKTSAKKHGEQESSTKDNKSNDSEEEEAKAEEKEGRQSEEAADEVPFVVPSDEQLGIRIGDNDGSVSARSSAWCTQFFYEPVWDGDHMSIVGWGNSQREKAGYGTKDEQNRQMKMKWRRLCEEIARQFPL